MSQIEQTSRWQAGGRESLRDFARRWAELGQFLDEERYAALQELDDETARQITLDLFKLWRPRSLDAMGGGLVEAQKVFIKLAQREAAEKQARRSTTAKSLTESPATLARSGDGVGSPAFRRNRTSAPRKRGTPNSERRLCRSPEARRPEAEDSREE